MKFIELPEDVQHEAAASLSGALRENGILGDEKRTGQAQGIADTIRDAYLRLYSEQQSSN
ncbi:hypothetical protein UDZ25_13345 [Serratia marcescens]|uniref:hypothetical protein n=1 Tax=Serratia marcescens TaxID=615 RepID=UPI0039BF2D9E